MKQLYLSLVVIVFFLFSCGESGPKRQLGFYNNSDQTLNLVIEDEEFSYYDEFIEPYSTGYYYIDTGTYDFVVWDEEGYFVREVLSYKVNENPSTAIENYLLFDLAAEYPTVVANLNSFYEGGWDYTQSVHSYKDKGLIHKYIDNTEMPFEPDFYYQTEWIHPFDDEMPNTIDAGDNVYAIIPLDMDYTYEEDVEEAIVNYIQENFN
ncbi:MAG: hypothetical protein ACPG4Z_01970 [Chitinophagales bacterium]